MNFIATVEDSHRERIREIAGALEKLGARVKDVQPILGVIAGSSEIVSLEQLKIEGIVSVEPDRTWGVEKPVRDAEKADDQRPVAKRSGGKAKRKD